MSSSWLGVALILPLVGAGLTVLAGSRRSWQRRLAVATVLGTTAVSVRLLVGVTDGDPVALAVGGWPASLGITLVVDLTSALLLVVSMLAVLGVLIFAIGQRAADIDTPAFYPVYLVMCAGVVLAFITGDLFSLFVSFELLLMASYLLLTLGRGLAQVRSAMTYVVINIVAGTLFLITIGLVYAATGTVNLAELSLRFGDLPVATATALGGLLLVVFGIKAAVFPLAFWLPDAYPTAPTPITAVFAGLLTKIGVYAMLRTMSLFDLHELGPVILAVASVTMLVGVAGAVAQDDVKRILSFHIISQIGYMLLGIGLFTTAGYAAAVVFIVHQIPVKTALFLVGGLIEARAGTSALRRVDGLAHVAPAVAILFALSALSLAGLPPFSGFVGKLALIESGSAAGAWVPVIISLVASVLTLLSMTKIWIGVFWGEPTVARRTGRPERRTTTMVTATAGIVAVTLGIALAAGPIVRWSQRAGEDLADRTAYVTAVLGEQGP